MKKNGKENTECTSGDRLLSDKLCLSNAGLVEQILKFVLSGYESSLQLAKTLDEKTNWILAVAGISLTAFFSYTGAVSEPEQKNLIFNTFYIITVSLHFFSIIILLLTFRARSDYRTATEKDILNGDVLSASDTDNNESVYTRYMIHHLIKVKRNNDEVNRRKACLLKSGQTVFLLSIISFFILVIKDCL